MTAGSERGLDVAGLVAIDTHVHIESQLGDNPAAEAARAYFGSGMTPTPEELVDYYRSRRLACVVFSVDETLTGRPQVPNDDVLSLAAANPDVVIPFASVNPMRGREAVDEARRLIAAGVRGFKIHPPLQQFHANDRAAYPFYEVVEGARLPLVTHTGHSGIGTGMRGGGGVRLKYGHPMDVDDVAVDFPDMPVILAHPSFPWQEEAISVCLHKTQVYIDLSGWSPKYFSPVLIQYANTLLKHKMLFGSDYPLITPDEVMRLPEDNGLVFIAGERPIWAMKARYFADARLAKRAGTPPPERCEPIAHAWETWTHSASERAAEGAPTERAGEGAPAEAAPAAGSAEELFDELLPDETPRGHPTAELA